MFMRSDSASEETSQHYTFFEEVLDFFDDLEDGLWLVGDVGDWLVGEGTGMVGLYDFELQE